MEQCGEKKKKSSANIIDESVLDSSNEVFLLSIRICDVRSNTLTVISLDFYC
jgi:hypothetical protein